MVEKLIDSLTDPTISFIIPARDAKTTLPRCLQSIQQQSKTFPYEIIVVDNSDEKSLDVIAQSYGAHYVWKQKRGAAAARNAGLKIAKGTFVAFIDADVVLDSEWTTACLKALEPVWLDCAQTSIFPAQTAGRNAMYRWRRAFIHAKTGGTFNYLSAALKGWPVVNSAAFMVKHALLKDKQLQFDEKLLRCEDMDFTNQLMFSGCHFVEAAESFAEVYDNRGPWDYLRRSFGNGFFTSKTRALWLEGKDSNWHTHWPSPLMLAKHWNRSPIATAFIKANQLSSIAGEFSFLKEKNRRRKQVRNPKAASALRPDFRNPVLTQFLKQKRLIAISPFVRIVLLKNRAVLYDLKAMRKVRLDESEREALIQMMSGSGKKPYATMTKLIDRLVDEEFLTVAEAAPTIVPKNGHAWQKRKQKQKKSKNRRLKKSLVQ